MKEIKLYIVLLLPLNYLFSFSIFNSRGLGGYEPPSEFLRIQPRSQTILKADFLTEYVHATEPSASKDAFLARPYEFGFFFPLPGRFGLSLGIMERYNLDFEVESDSIESDDYTLIRRIASRGGIESFRISVDKSLFNLIYLGAGYERLLGGAWERWDSEILKLEGDSVIYQEATVDSLLYHFGGNGFWGIAGIHLGKLDVRGFYGYPLDIKVLTEVQTKRDTSVIDSAFYVPPAEFGGIVSWATPKYSISASYIQQSGGTPSGLAFVPAHTLELNSSFALKPFSLTAKAGWMSWYTTTVDSLPINDFYLGVGSRIPIQSFGFGNVELNSGIRTGGDITEYHVGLKLGLEFTELWKKRERMWGG